MQTYSLKCYKCNVTQNDNSISRIFCEKGCNELLICQDISPMKQDPLQSMKDDEESFSLGEGSTPLIPLNKIGKRLGLEKLFAKLEFMSPTGSFKDRGSSLVINIARKERVAEFVEDSSGNAGASLSAYAGATDIKAHILSLIVPEKVNLIKSLFLEQNYTKYQDQGKILLLKQRNFLKKMIFLIYLIIYRHIFLKV